MARSAASIVSQTITPLPDARPDALMTTGAPSSRTASRAEATSWCQVARAVGTPALNISSFAKRLDDSILGGGRRWAERPESARGQPIDQPGRQRRLRADDGEIEALPDPQRDEAVQIGGQRPVAYGQRFDAGIPRSAVKVQRWIVVLQLPGDRVFATATADDQDFHSEIFLWPLSSELWPVRFTSPRSTS